VIETLSMTAASLWITDFSKRTRVSRSRPDCGAAKDLIAQLEDMDPKELLNEIHWH
jgi:hypothetical protein